MRNYLLFLVVVLIFSGCATSFYGPKATPEDLKMEKTIEAAGKSKDQLYVLSNSWFVSRFVKANSVIEFSDKEAGRIMGKFLFNYLDGIYNYEGKSTITVDVKDSKLRIKMEDPYFAYVGDGRGYKANPAYKKVETQQGISFFKKEWTALAKDLEDYINKGEKDDF